MTIHTILPLNDFLFDKDEFIVINNPSQTPPHLGIIIGKKYYSASVNKNECIEVPTLLKSINISKRETLFIKINNIGDSALFNRILLNTNFKSGNATCLSPIRNYYQACGFEVKRTHFIFELLLEMQNNNALKQAYHLFMENRLSNCDFTLTTYTLETVNAHINALRSKSTAHV